MVPAHIHIVPLALSVPAVRVGGGDVKAGLRSIGDLQFHPVSAAGPLEPVFRDLHQFSGGGVVLHYHAGPRHNGVEGAAAVSVVHGRRRVHEGLRRVRPAPGGGCRPVPLHAVDLRETDGHAAGLGCRRVVVAVRRHVDCHGYVSVLVAGHGDLVPARAHTGHVRGAALCADRPGTGSRHGDGLAGVVSVQGHAGGGEGEAAGGLLDAPGHRLVPGGAVRPLGSYGVFQGELGVVTARVGPRRDAADGHFRGVVVVPGGGLRPAVVGEAPALRGYRDVRLLNRHRLLGLGCDAALRVEDRHALRALRQGAAGGIGPSGGHCCCAV